MGMPKDHDDFLCFHRHMEIVPFFKVLEGEQQLSTMILDYSISQTTLEEVFLNVSHCL